MSTEVVMPQMGESIAEGTITKWLKKIGERVERDEPLFEISTDKVDAEIPSPSAGTLTEIKAQEGETVAVNSVVATIDGAAATDSAAPQIETAPIAETAPVAAAPATFSPAVAAPRSAPEPATQTQPVASAPEVQRPSSQSAPVNGGEQTAEEMRRTRSSPLVRKIASEHGINISQLEGTGTSGRVTKNDILSYIESGATPESAAATAPATSISAPALSTVAAPAAMPIVQSQALAPAAGDRVETMSVIRRKIAEHMTLSRRTSAHVTTVYEIDMTRVARLREEQKGAFLERHGTKLTFMPFIFQAVTSAIRKFPVFNAQLGGDQIIYKRDINLGMAVSLDWGLIVPVIKRADELSIAGLARAANDLAERARSKQLKPDEVSGGTFTITNPGVFGGLFGTPIINQPQVAILGIGVVEKRPLVMTSPEGEDYLAIRSMAYFALSFDHRLIDGSDAEKFLAYVKSVLEAGQFAV
ncbi:MAG: 2-oxoglutarate dehydrogenase, E2 component, dihydrolipoamide succinyltransferase [Pyrinomonadaceae bacterium]